jgi:hypothetical protein
VPRISGEPNCGGCGRGSKSTHAPDCPSKLASDEPLEKSYNPWPTADEKKHAEQVVFAGEYKPVIAAVLAEVAKIKASGDEPESPIAAAAFVRNRANLAIGMLVSEQSRERHWIRVAAFGVIEAMRLKAGGA